MSKTRLNHYEIKAGLATRKGKNRWQVFHKASGRCLTPLGLLNSCTKTEARQWAERAEREAPTDCPNEAGRLLVATGYPQDWRQRALKMVGLD